MARRSYRSPAEGRRAQGRVSARAIAAGDVPATGWVRATLSGLCAILVGIGLARFAYTPLLPAVIAAEWFPPSQAAYLGAANLAGYLAGALVGRQLASRAPAAVILRSMMVLASASLLACAAPVSFLWFFLWRFVSGAAGGVLMVLAAPTVLPHVPSSRRGLAGGVIFTGVGLGIAASGTLVPVLLEWGLVETWSVLGGFSLLLTAAAWNGWPADDRIEPTSRGTERSSQAYWLPRLKVLYAQYGLNAFGLVPHMVFLVDFIARALGQGIATGAQYWTLFGVGALIGPTLAGHIADRIGFGPALRIAFAVQACGVGLLVISDHVAALVLSSLVIGALVPGMSVVALGRLHELLAGEGSDARTAAWRLATMAFAVGQAVASYGFSFLFAAGVGYGALFALSALALNVAFVLDLTVSSKTATTSSAGS